MVDLGRELRVRYDFIASTGRTATTFIASRLNRIGGVAACHEGYRGSDKGEEPLLPLINLENALVFGKPDTADDIVAEKRGVPMRYVVQRALRNATTLLTWLITIQRWLKVCCGRMDNQK